MISHILNAIPTEYMELWGCFPVNIYDENKILVSSKNVLFRALDFIRTLSREVD